MYAKNSPKKIFFLGLDKHFFHFFLNLAYIFYNKMTFFTLDRRKKHKKSGFMNQNLSQNALEIIEVPPELRGLSDDEIIQNSMKTKKDFTGKRKNGAARPSKRERLIQKQEQARKETESIAAEIFGVSSHAPKPDSFDLGLVVPPEDKLSREQKKLLDSAFTPRSTGFSKTPSVNSLFSHPASSRPEPQSMISEAPKPTSGRVLKASFGIKGKEQPKAVIVNAADLAKQRAEERAKKVQAAFRAKHPEATTMPDGTPIKRGRGRPRKNPVV